jgi:hypothetical protein
MHDDCMVDDIHIVVYDNIPIRDLISLILAHILLGVISIITRCASLTSGPDSDCKNFSVQLQTHLRNRRAVSC